MATVDPSVYALLAVAPFQIACMIYTGRRALAVPTLVTCGVHLQNWFTLMFLIGCSLLLVQEVDFVTALIISNWGMGPGQLLHTVLMLNRFGLFRTSIRWYTQRIQKWTFALTCLVHVILMWPNYLEYLISSTDDYDTLPGLAFVFDWMMTGLLVWAFFMYAIDIFTSVVIFRIVMASKRIIGGGTQSGVATTTPAETPSSQVVSQSGGSSEMAVIRWKILLSLCMMITFDIIFIIMYLVNTNQFAAYLQALTVIHFIVSTVYMNLLAKYVAGGSKRGRPSSRKGTETTTGGKLTNPKMTVAVNP